MDARKRKLLRMPLAILAVLLVAAGIAYAVANEPRPHGVTGTEAERMTDAMLRSVNDDAWQRTAAVRFTFRRRNTHLWDRARDYDRVRHADTEVLLRIDNRTGIAREGGRRVHGARAHELVEEAYAEWANDSYWLNPLAKMRDHGVTRGIVRGHDGVTRLLVSCSDGGVTPGDAYLWTPGRSGGPPTEWRMWVSILPLGGLRATWERWVTLHTGARISTLHRIGPVRVELSDVDGRDTLRELGGDEDPFVDLVRENAENAPDEPPPAEPGPARPPPLVH